MSMRRRPEARGSPRPMQRTAAATVALATSKYFWALLGLAWLINRVGWLWS